MLSRVRVAERGKVVRPAHSFLLVVLQAFQLVFAFMEDANRKVDCSQSVSAQHDLQHRKEKQERLTMYSLAG